MEKLLGIGAIARALGVHENTIRNWSREGKIPFELTAGGQRRFALKDVRSALGDLTEIRFNKKFELSGLAEDNVWREVKVALAIVGNEAAADIAIYAFTEMLNNAIDHSRGSCVTVAFEIGEQMWSFEIVDDGVGIFAHIQESFQLNSPLEAIGELTKGKRTSAPEAHTGEGIFFTSKLVMKFSLESQGIQWLCDNRLSDSAILSSDFASGTRVRCDLDTNPQVTSIEIFEQFSQNHIFTKSRPVIKLFELGSDFVSRSEAKRLVAGLEKFTEVDLDFAKVRGIGQGFADQVFRVWQNSQPGTQLRAINTSPEVQFMIDRTIGGGYGNN